MVASIARKTGALSFHRARSRRRRDAPPRKRPRHRGRLRTASFADKTGRRKRAALIFFQRPREPGQSLANLCGRPGGKAQQQGRRKLGPDAKKGKAADLYSELRFEALEPRKVFREPEPGERMQTGIRSVESEAVSEQTVEQLDEQFTPLGINFSHPPNVTEIEPFVD